jgi:acyl-CoA reductase-like NAD-dependent aldehyde dehydrogenase
MLSDGLEQLGGKSPVIITRSANLKVSARRILSIKALGTGQMCSKRYRFTEEADQNDQADWVFISSANADYILCPSDMVDELMKVCAEV